MGVKSPGDSSSLERGLATPPALLPSPATLTTGSHLPFPPASDSVSRDSATGASTGRPLGVAMTASVQKPNSEARGESPHHYGHPIFLSMVLQAASTPTIYPIVPRQEETEVSDGKVNKILRL